MPNYEQKIVFVDRKLCWTETYYLVAPDLYSSLLTLRKLALARATLLNGNVVIGRVRTAEIGGVRQVLQDGITQTASSVPGYHPAVCCGLTLVSQPPNTSHSYSAHLYLRGLPVGFWYGEPGPPLAITLQWRSVLQNYAATLITLGYSLQVKSKSLPLWPIAAIKRYAAINADCMGNPLSPATLTPGESVLCLYGRFAGLARDLANVVSPSVQVRVNGVKWSGGAPLKPYGVNGLHYVQGWDDDVIAVKGLIPLAGEPLRLGTVRLEQVIYPPITSTVIGPGGKRDVGGRSKLRAVIGAGRVPEPKIAIGPGYPEQVAPEPPPPPPPPIPVVITCNTALDVWQLVWLGYNEDAQGFIYPIGIYHVANMGNTWLVTASGTYLAQDSATFISEDILAGANQPDLFQDSLYTAIISEIPSGAHLLLAGHSLGGMELQNVAPRLSNAGYAIDNLFTCGTPVTTINWSTKNVNRMYNVGDLVIYASPIALFSFLYRELLYEVIDDPNLGKNPIAAHTGYVFSQQQVLYDPLGNKLPYPAKRQNVLELDEGVRYRAKWYPIPPQP